MSATDQPYAARRQNWTNQLARHALMQPDTTALRYLGRTTTWAELQRQGERAGRRAEPARREVRRSRADLDAEPPRVRRIVLGDQHAGRHRGAGELPDDRPGDRASWSRTAKPGWSSPSRCWPALLTRCVTSTPTLGTVIVAGSGCRATDRAGLRGPAGRGRRTPHQPVDIPNDSPALIMYTSGTTGGPRAPCSPTPIWPARR